MPQDSTEDRWIGGRPDFRQAPSIPTIFDSLVLLLRLVESKISVVFLNVVSESAFCFLECRFSSCLSDSRRYLPVLRLSSKSATCRSLAAAAATQTQLATTSVKSVERSWIRPQQDLQCWVLRTNFIPSHRQKSLRARLRCRLMILIWSLSPSRSPHLSLAFARLPRTRPALS